MTIWDTGTLRDREVERPRRSIVRLHGERARGRYVFIRTDRERGKDNWLLRRSDPAPDRDPLPHDARPMLADPGPAPPRRATGGCRWASAGGG